MPRPHLQAELEELGKRSGRGEACTRVCARACPCVCMCVCVGIIITPVCRCDEEAEALIGEGTHQ